MNWGCAFWRREGRCQRLQCRGLAECNARRVAAIDAPIAEPPAPRPIKDPPRDVHYDPRFIPFAHLKEPGRVCFNPSKVAARILRARAKLSYDATRLIEYLSTQSTYAPAKNVMRHVFGYVDLDTIYRLRKVVKFALRLKYPLAHKHGKGYYLTSSIDGVKSHDAGNLQT
jgi:hypothetical protein